VLLAEDNAVNELIAVSILNGMGFDVSVAASGLEAVKLHRDGKFDLILMDCHMPDLDGVQATLRIRQAESRRQRTPIVAVTASALREDRERCLAAGMDDYLPKPFTREALEAVVAKLVAPESALTARPHLEGEPQRCEVEPSPLAQTAP
jgi:CheY-like chemotaxis protein